MASNKNGGTEVDAIDLSSYESINEVSKMKVNTSAFLILQKYVHSYSPKKLCFLQERNVDLHS